jgi:hypothetical protein
MVTIIDDVWYPATWMANTSRIISKRRLCNLAIPGTHDSGSYGIPDNSQIDDEPGQPISGFWKWLYNNVDVNEAKYIFKAWSQTTDYTIRKQLDAGIRYLDLRVIKKDGDYYFCHTLLSAKVDDCIRDVAEFIQANPKEIVILDFNHIYGTDATDLGLCNKLTKTFGSKIAPNSMNAKNSVGDFWNGGYQVIILWQDREPIDTMGVPFWKHVGEDWQDNNDDYNLRPENQIHARWIREQNAMGLKKEVFRDLQARLNHNELSDKLYVTQCLISPDQNTLAGGVCSCLEKENIKQYNLIREEAENYIMGKYVDNPQVKSRIPNLARSLRELAKQTVPIFGQLRDNREVVQNIILVDWFEDIPEFTRQVNVINLEYKARHGKDI